jgi:uncharacterized membrane protein (DUF485 family)
MLPRLPRTGAIEGAGEQESIVSSTNEPPTTDDPERHLPPHHNPLPELTGESHAPISQAAFERVHGSEDFNRLRTTFRRFAFPMTAVFVVWYFLYVLLSTYAHDFMSLPFIGYINVGMAMGLAQFVTTFLITWLYVRHANRNLDPLAGQLRDELEGGSHANG